MEPDEIYRFLSGIASCYRAHGYEIDELVNVGYLGFAKAESGFNEAVGVPFRAYARLRVHGEIKDFLRRNQPGKRVRGQRPVVVSLDEILRCEPSEPSAHYARLMASLAVECEPPDCLLHDQLRRAVADLPARKRDIVIRCYWQNVTQEQIAAELGLSEARVSQLLQVARQMLKKSIKERQMRIDKNGRAA